MRPLCLSFSTRVSTFSTFSPPALAGGSCTCSTFRRGEPPETPKSAAGITSMGFFLAFWEFQGFFGNFFGIFRGVESPKIREGRPEKTGSGWGNWDFLGGDFFKDFGDVLRDFGVLRNFFLGGLISLSQGPSVLEGNPRCVGQQVYPQGNFGKISGIFGDISGILGVLGIWGIPRDLGNTQEFREFWG